ncbi:MAG: hypothetical protein U5L95_00175 [Candidatus Saccharibacteria bacterium]|nr:hypothetical protein [Candidatus Saccharibacteria bacterium]
MNTKRLPELSEEAKGFVADRVDEVRKDVLSEADPRQILITGEEVMIDALRRRPKMRDVQTAPDSFHDGIQRLVTVAQPEAAFQLVGEAVEISRIVTQQDKAFEIKEV